MTYLKIKEYVTAEQDATSALSLDQSHIKSYQRRSKARIALGKFRAAIKDLDYAIFLDKEQDDEDDNTKIKKELQKEKEYCVQLFIRAIRSCPKRRIKNIDIVNENGICEVKHAESKRVNDPSKSQDEINSCSLTEIHDTTDTSSPTTIIDLIQSQESVVAQNNGKVVASFQNKTSNKKASPKTFQEFQTIWRSLIEKSDKLKFLIKQSSKNIYRIFHTYNFDDTDLFTELFDVLLSSVSSSSFLLMQKDSTSNKSKKKINSFIKSLLTIPTLDILIAMMSKYQRKKIDEHLCCLDDVNCFLFRDTREMILNKFGS